MAFWLGEEITNPVQKKKKTRPRQKRDETKRREGPLNWSNREASTVFPYLGKRGQGHHLFFLVSLAFFEHPALVADTASIRQSQRKRKRIQTTVKNKK